MADASFDVVIVGGGCKGLALACYLAKYGGMSVGIFERRHELGLGVYSLESPAPGFTANHCSHWHSARSYYGIFQEDFPEAVDYGLQYKPMLLTFGQYFIEDDSWIGTYHPHFDPTGERTAELWARFSEKDAEKWLYLHDKIKKYWEPAMWEYMHTPAPPPGIPSALTRLALFSNPEETGFNPQWVMMAPYQVYQDMFESPECQLAWARFVWSATAAPDAWAMGMIAAGVLIICLQGADVLPGGSHTVAHVEQKIILENGGKIFANSEVKKILVENGRAKGIRLADGTEIEAKQAVAINVTPFALIELLGREHFSSKILRRIEQLERDFTCISWYTWALHEHPHYKGEAFHPDIKGMDWISVGTKSMEDMLRACRRQRMKMWPEAERPGGLTLCISDHSRAVPELAPPGKATVLTECYVPPANSHTPEEWKEFEKRHAEDIIREWGKIAPNMTWDNVIGYNPITPYHLAQLDPFHFGREGNWFQIDMTAPQVDVYRPCAELSSNKVPGIDNLYLTGVCYYPPAGGGSFQPGYVTYKIMAIDIGLRMPWEEKGRPY